MATVLFVGEVIADGPDIVYEASTEQRRRTAWSMRGVTRPSEGTKMELRLKPLARLIDTLPEGDLERFVEAGLTGDFTCARHLLATARDTHNAPLGACEPLALLRACAQTAYTILTVGSDLIMMEVPEGALANQLVGPCSPRARTWAS